MPGGIVYLPFTSLVTFDSVGTHTWIPSMHTPPEPTGYRVEYYVVTCYGGGQSGYRGNNAPGGSSGGRATAEIRADEAGSSQTVTVGNGGARRTSNGVGNSGGPSSFGLLLESSPGSSSIPSLWGDVASSSAPGAGGTAGLWVKGDVDTFGAGAAGESSSTALGGSGYIPPGGWGSFSAATDGSDGQTDGWRTSGGGGGGGGSGQTSAGGDGGAPGGGGGGSGGTSGAGGRGQVDVLAVYTASAALLSIEEEEVV